MAFTVNAFNHQEWKRLGLADYGDFADMISECNVGEDAFSGYGEWFYIPDEPLPNNDRVIYFGTWSNDNSPGASSYTHAEICDMDDPVDAAEYQKRVEEWESQPRWDDKADVDTESVKDAYRDGVCPDCGEDIQDDVKPGEECSNCGHVFWPETDGDDEMEEA